MDNSPKTLWVWDTLPQKELKSEEQTWLKAGDAVENVHRLKLGKIMCISIFPGNNRFLNLIMSIE